MPASSNSRPTPTSVTHAPLPPEPTTPMRFPSSARIGRGWKGGKTSAAGGGFGRATRVEGREDIGGRRRLAPVDERQRQQRLARVEQERHVGPERANAGEAAEL